MRSVSVTVAGAEAVSESEAVEGSGRRGRERKRFYQVAHASAREAKSAVRIVVRLNAIDQARSGSRSGSGRRTCFAEPPGVCWTSTAAMGHGGPGSRSGSGRRTCFAEPPRVHGGKGV